MKKCILLYCYLFLAIASHVQAELMSHVVSPNRAVIGQVIELSLKTRNPIKTSLTPDMVHPFELVDVQKSDTQLIASLRLYELGEHQIPSFNIIAGTKQLFIPEKTINIIKTNPNDEIAELVKGISLEKPWKKWLFMFSICLIILGLIALSLKKISRRQKEQKNHLENPRQNAAKICLRHLKHLEKQHLDPEHHFLKISQIFRAYLNRRYTINALELTSTELLSFLETQKLSPETLKRANTILKTCDTIKFFKANKIDQDFINSTVIPFIKRLEEEKT